MKKPYVLAIGALAGVAAIAGAAGASTHKSVTPAKAKQAAVRKAYTGAPYLVRMHAGTEIKQILTVGDSVPKAGGGTYRMVGIPDGLGAFDNGDGTFTVLMNHELTSDKGIVRAHGGKGTFVSKWIVKKSDMSIVSGQDLMKATYVYANGTWAPASTSLSRFCSADLPALSAFYNEKTKLGYNGRLFMNGEETGAEGTAWAHDMNGNSWQLPHLGRFSWENSLANAWTGDKTVVVGTDDQGGGKGQVYVYVGDKKASGTTIEKAGLTGGKLYGIKVTGVAAESSSSAIANGTAFSLYEFGDVSSWTGAKLETESNANGVTNFRRPEDGSWDAKKPNVFYVNTTDSFGTAGRSRLYKLTFKDINNPQLGGTVDALLAGTEGQQMLDNMGVDQNGKRILLQEDIGEQRQRGKLWMYNLNAGTLRNVAEFNDDLFNPEKPGFITADEETSGAISVADILGKGWFLLTVQVHAPWAPAGFTAPTPGFPFTDPELVEGGALVALYIPEPR